MIDVLNFYNTPIVPVILTQNNQARRFLLVPYLGKPKGRKLVTYTFCFLGEVEYGYLLPFFFMSSFYFIMIF